jgi:Tfp pilus assembly PilM family ATPase
MASSKRIGFFCGAEKVTLVEFEKNAPPQVVSSPLDLQIDASSPFSSNFTEEIQITAIFQKMLRDNQIAGGPFYVSLPLKEIMLRSFVIPFVKKGDIQNVIKFEAKKHLPIDIQDLAFVFSVIPFTENKIERLRIIFFAARKESLARYERIFQQVNAVVSYCEPCVVSLIKVLLFKKEISPSDHFAFLILDKHSGSIFFIDRGIPQFVREFSIRTSSPLEKTKDSIEILNLKIVNEVGNSFNFYARQFKGDRVEQMLVSTQEEDQDLFNALETELKLKLRKISPIVTMGDLGQSNDMDAIYAMGACVEPPIEQLSGFNLLEDKTSKAQFKDNFVKSLNLYKKVIFISLICVISLVGLDILFQAQLKVVQQQYDQLSSKQGTFLNVPVGSIQDELKDNTDKLVMYKNIRTKSDVVLILLRVASHLPQGALLTELNVNYDQGDSNDAHVTIDMRGDVFREDPNEQIAVVNQIFSDFKNDEELSRFIKNVNLVSLNRENFNGRKVVQFNIHCS